MPLLSEQGGIYTGSAFDYRLMPEVRGYVPIGERVTIAARLVFGQMFAKDLGSPITSASISAIPNSHRGFTYNRLSYQVCSGVPLGAVPIPTRLPCDSDTSSAIADFRRIPDQRRPDAAGTAGVPIVAVQSWPELGVDGRFRRCRRCRGTPRTACTDPNNCPVINIRIRSTSNGSMSRWVVGCVIAPVIGTIRFDLGVRLNRLDAVEDGIEP